MSVQDYNMRSVIFSKAYTDLLDAVNPLLQKLKEEEGRLLNTRLIVLSQAYRDMMDEGNRLQQKLTAFEIENIELKKQKQ